MVDLVDAIERFVVQDDVADGLAFGDVVEAATRAPAPTPAALA